MGMFLIKFVVWCVISYGISTIIVESILFKWIRDEIKRRHIMLHNLLTCMLCTGVWVGFLMSVNVWSPVEFIFDGTVPYYIQVFVDGILSSQVVWGICMVEKYFTAVTLNLLNLQPKQRN